MLVWEPAGIAAGQLAAALLVVRSAMDMPAAIQCV